MHPKAEAITNSFTGLNEFIEQEISSAKAELDKNTISQTADIKKLQEGLDSIWRNIKEKNYAENNGTDAELRPSYVVMQGIIEREQARALEKGAIKSAEGFIITPRMPTPLMLDSGKNLGEVNLADPQAFALYRNPILNEFLQAGGILNAIYSHDAKTALSNHETGLANYATHLTKYKNLKDNPIIKSDMAKFPAELTGAMYLVDDQPITVESKQITQIDNSKAQSWAIRFGKAAEPRASILNKFLKENNYTGMVK